MKYHFILILLFFSVLDHNAQDILNDTLYYDKKDELCDKSSAEYFTVIKPDAPNFIVSDFYMNRQLKMQVVCILKDSIVRNGKCTYYNKDGKIEKEGYYKDGVEIGTWVFTEYLNKGNISRTGFLKGELYDSLVTDYFASGRIYSTCYYKNDTLNGLYSFFREDNSLFSTCNYLMGKRHGWLTWYKKNGKKDYEEEYILGKKTGSKRLYYSNGQVHGEFIWKKKRKDGYKIWYFSDGTIDSKVTFTNGKRKKEI